MSTRGRLLVRAVILLDILLVAVFPVLAAVGGADWGSHGLGGAVSLAMPGIAFTVVGGLIATRRPGHRIGWLCLAIGAMWMVVVAASAFGTWAAETDRSGAAVEWLAWFGWLWVPAVGVMGTHLPLRLPDGRLPSPRWRRYSRFCTVAILLVSALMATAPRETDESFPDNPVALDLPAAAGLVFLFLPLSLLGAVVSVVVRYRRTADARARLQIRWIAFGAAFFVASYIATVGLLASLGSSEDEALGTALVYFGQVAYLAIPVAIGIAILRHRLYEIDRIINRTLVYGSVTAVLAAGYVVLVLALRSVIGPLTDGNGVAVALSTLAVASLFRPVRRRAQSLVDRRFNRRKYDAERTLERFGARLRAETDLAALQAELTAVVGETMQPAHVSLWLRGSGR